MMPVFVYDPRYLDKIPISNRTLESFFVVIFQAETSNVD